MASNRLAGLAAAALLVMMVVAGGQGCLGKGLAERPKVPAGNQLRIEDKAEVRDSEHPERNVFWGQAVGDLQAGIEAKRAKFETGKPVQFVLYLKRTAPSGNNGGISLSQWELQFRDLGRDESWIMTKTWPGDKVIPVGLTKHDLSVDKGWACSPSRRRGSQGPSLLPGIYVVRAKCTFGLPLNISDDRPAGQPRNFPSVSTGPVVIEIVELGDEDKLRLLSKTLKNGTAEEKEEVLDFFMKEQPVRLVPAVIDAILDDTASPRHDDTGWGTIHHQAATAMCEFAQRFDGKSQKERSRNEFSFYNDGAVGTEKRRKEVHENWLEWWRQNKTEMERRLATLRVAVGDPIEKARAVLARAGAKAVKIPLHSERPFEAFELRKGLKVVLYLKDGVITSIMQEDFEKGTTSPRELVLPARK